VTDGRTDKQTEFLWLVQRSALRAVRARCKKLWNSLRSTVTRHSPSIRGSTMMRYINSHYITSHYILIRRPFSLSMSPVSCILSTRHRLQCTLTVFLTVTYVFQLHYVFRCNCVVLWTLYSSAISSQQLEGYWGYWGRKVKGQSYEVNNRPHTATCTTLESNRT